MITQRTDFAFWAAIPIVRERASRKYKRVISHTFSDRQGLCRSGDVVQDANSFRSATQKFGRRRAVTALAGDAGDRLTT